MSEQTNKTEGWTWLVNARKWHYFVDGRSLCGSYMVLTHPHEGYEVDNHGSSSNCASCRRKILAIEEKEQDNVIV